MSSDQLHYSSSGSERAPISELGATLRRRAERAGKSIAELRADDWEALGVPTAIECLDPFELEEYFAGTLSEDRVAHVDNCSRCAALLDIAKPRKKWFEEFIKSAAAQEALRQSALMHRRKLWKPVFDISIVEVIIILGVSLFGVYVIKSSDVIVSNLIRESAFRSGIIIAGIGVISLLVTTAGAKWFSLSRPCFQAFGGLTLGGIFACVVCVFIGHVAVVIVKNYGTMQNAQYALFGQIALAQDRGQLYADSFYREKLENLPGALVAERDQQAFNISWEKPAGYLQGARSSVLGTVYEGDLKAEKDGAPVVQIGNRELDLALGSFASRFRFGMDGKVLAFVPFNAQEVSAVIPVAGGDASISHK